MFIKISNNFGILLTVHKYIKLKGLNTNMELKHHNIHMYKYTHEKTQVSGQTISMKGKCHKKKRKRNYIRACVLTRSISGSEYNSHFSINDTHDWKIIIQKL